VYKFFRGQVIHGAGNMEHRTPVVVAAAASLNFRGGIVFHGGESFHGRESFSRGGEFFTLK